MTGGLGQGAAPIIVLGLILLGSTSLMSDATQDSARFGELYSALLAINAVALIGLGVLIARHLYRLLHQARERRPGAKLTVRMVIVFVVLSVTPVTIVYYFSLKRRASSSALTACSSASGTRSDAIRAVCARSSRMRTPSAVRLKSSASFSASSIRTSNQLSIPR